MDVEPEATELPLVPTITLTMLEPVVCKVLNCRARVYVRNPNMDLPGFGSCFCFVY